MRVFIKIFCILFGIVAGILVLISLLIVTPIYLSIFALGGENADRTAHKLSRFWASWVLISCGVRLKVHDINRVDPKMTYVFVSNHRSYLDIPVAARSTLNTFKFLAKEELGKVPLLGYIITKLYITVRRQSIRDKVMAIKKMEAELDKGISVWLYPEGTRNKTNDPLTEFQDGAFTVAINSGKPIAVLTVYDTRKVLDMRSFFKITPAKVEAWWSEPIETIGLTRKDIPILKEKVRKLMEMKIVNISEVKKDALIKNNLNNG